MERVLGFMVLDDTTPVGRGVSEPSDPHAELAERARSGDRAALRKLLVALGPRLLRVVRGVLGAGHPELEDVLQDVTVLVVRALGAFRGEGEIEGYVVRIALRAAITARKKYRARANVTEPEEARAETGEPPSDESLALRRRTILRELLEEIPEPQAEALVMRSILGMSLEETAKLAGAPENTIRSRIRLAREALKKRIESDPVLLESLEIHS